MKDIGQCLMIGLQGEELLLEEKKLIENEDIGAVLLFKRNCLDYEKLKHLCKSLHQLKTSAPLIIAIDREGGSVDRLTSIPEFIPWPNPSLLLKKFSISEIGYISFLLNQELKHLGINMNLSPCLDLTHPSSLVLKNRTFSKNPLTVGQVGGAFIQGAHQAQVLSCAKHFPGHGGVSEDSHLIKPIDTSQNISPALIPFRMAQAQHVPCMMLSHILYPALDSKNVASLSRKIIQNLLKEKLHFSGLILTDDLDMKALQEYSPFEIAEKSLSAGAHMLICGNKKETVYNIISSTSQSLKNLAHLRKKEVLKFKKQHLDKLTPSYPPLHPHLALWKKQVQKLKKEL